VVQMSKQDMTIRMTEDSLKHLMMFLSRVNLNAKEVMSFAEIMNELKMAMPSTRERIKMDELN
jgi:hypothetical protein